MIQYTMCVSYSSKQDTYEVYNSLFKERRSFYRCKLYKNQEKCSWK